MSFLLNQEKTEIITERFIRRSVSDRVVIYSQIEQESSDEFAEDVKSGLTNNPKILLPKYFYDDNGSGLFEEITRLKEYYPTETERSIIKNISPILPKICGGISDIVEIGSGNSDKTQHIIESFSTLRKNVTYIPLDISDIIIESSKNLANKFNNIFIEGIISEYYSGLEIASEINDEPKLYLFLGSSIGNFTFNESIEFLQNLNAIMNKDDLLLIGFDRIKDRKVLYNAYDDSNGITAKFNLNILERINNELNADFDPGAFEHQIRFNEKKSRIEMHLVSNKLQCVHIKDLEMKIQFQAGESIHTENSYKYSDVMINKLAQESGLRLIKNFTDQRNYFSLCLFSLVD